MTSAITAAQTDTIDLADAARSLRRGWREVLGCFLFGIAVAGAIMLWAPRRYKAPASIIVKQSDAGASLLSKFTGGGDLSGLMSSAGKSSLETELTILKSRALAARVIDSLQLKMYARDGRQLDHQDAIKYFSNHLNVEKIAGDVVGIEYSAKDSLTAARVPNALVALYLARRKTTDRGVNAHRVEFLQQRLDSVSVSLTAAENQLRREQEASGLLDPIQAGKTQLERFGELRTQLTQLQMEGGALDQLMQQVKAGTMTTRQLGAYPSFIKSAGVSQLLGQLSAMDAQRLQLLATRTEADRDVEALTQSIATVEGQLLPIAQSYSQSIAAQKRDMQAELDSLNVSMLSLPKSAQATGRLQRDVLRLGQIYAALQAQLVEATLAAISEGGDVRQLDAAEPPLRPSFPQPLLTMGIGAGGGLVLGILMAFLMGAMGRWARDPHEIERVTGLPALSFDAHSPLLIAPMIAARTTLVLPLDNLTSTDDVARRLAETATARAITATVLDLTNAVGADANAAIERLEAEFDSVIVQLPPLNSQTAAAALRDNRPVVLVASAPRVDKSSLFSALGTLKRLDVPCAGIVMSDPRRKPRLSPGAITAKA